MAISVIGGSTAAPASSAAGWLGLGSVASGFSSVGNYSVPIPRPGAYYLFSSSGTNSKVIFNNAGTGNIYNTNFTGLGGTAYSATLGSAGTASNTVSSITFSSQWNQNTTPTNVSAAAYGAGLYVFGNLSGDMYSSPDLVTWTSRGNIGPVYVRAIIWNGSNFIATGANIGGGTGIIATSPDGITWTARTSPTTTNRDVAFGAANIIVSASNNGIYSSTDYTTWTLRQNNSYTAVAHNGLAVGSGSLFVGVGFSSVIFTSPDGITWTSRSNPGGQFTSVAYGNGMWVVTAESGTILSSPDGITWTQRVSSTFYSGTAHNVNSVAYNNGRFVATTSGAMSEVTGGFLISTDGITWRPHGGANNPASTAGLPRVISAGNGRFLYSPVASYISNSTDGLTCAPVGFALMSPSFPTVN